MLEKEAVREQALNQQELEAFERLQQMSIRSAEEQQIRTLLQARENSERVAKHLRLSSIIHFSRWCVPAAFAILLAHWMVAFYRSGACDSARSLRELLILMIGGALGWIAQAKTELGTVARGGRSGDPP